MKLSRIIVIAALLFSVDALADGPSVTIDNDAAFNSIIASGLDLARQGKWTDAMAKFDAVLAKRPNSAIALANRASCLLQLGREDEALKDVAKAEAADPKSTGFLEANVAEFFLDKGKDRVEAKDAAGARAALNRAIKHPKTKAAAYSELAYVDMMTGQMKSCVTNATLAIQADATLADAYGNRSACFLNGGKYADALADLDEAVNLDPSSAPLRLNRTSLESRLKYCAKAKADAAVAVRLDPSTAATADDLVSKCK